MEDSGEFQVVEHESDWLLGRKALLTEIDALLRARQSVLLLDFPLWERLP